MVLCLSANTRSEKMNRSSVITFGLIAILFGVTIGSPIVGQSNTIPRKLHIPEIKAETFDDILKINAFQGNFFEGDIVMPNERNAVQDKTLRWTTTVPYMIHDEFSFEIKYKIITALDELQVRSCMKFVDRGTEENYIIYEIKNGCYSGVGMSGGKQSVSIGSGCEYHRTIIHETLHALGFWHEQSRTDRDDNVKIVWENIADGQEYNFEKYDETKLDAQGVPYDYNSIMHYGDTAFSKNGSKTIIALKEGAESMGKLDYMSAIDVQELNLLYECQEKLDSNGYTDWTEWSPCDTNCKMERKRFCDGNNCAEWGKVETETSDCNEQCEVGLDPDCGPKVISGVVGAVHSPLYPYSYKSNAACITTIQVPEGARIRLMFQDMDIEDYQGGCYYDFLHLYDGADENAEEIGTFCSTNLPNVVSSSGNTLTLRFTSDQSVQKGGFRATYYATYAPIHSCEFEDDGDMCGWTNDATAEITFQRNSGPTPSVETGPQVDHTFASPQGHYLYIEASSPAVNGDRARLISPTFLPTSAKFCFIVWYNMYGVNTGSLNIYLNSADSTALTTYSGDKGNDLWYQSKTTIESSEEFQVIIEAVRGNGYKGDIGIDDVIVEAGQCA